MTALVALVADAADAATAVAGGADRLVVRTARPDGVAAVAAACGERCPIALWWDAAGEPPAAAVARADQVWGPDPAAAPGRAAWAVVAPGALPGIAVAGQRGCIGIVVDGGAGPGRLLASVTVAALEAQRQATRAAGLAFGFAANMEAPDVPRLLAFAPDLMVFGDVLRRDGGAAAPILLDRVRMARALVDDANRRSGPVRPEPAGRPDRIFLRDWVVAVPLGAYRHEHAPQRVRFTVEAEVERTAERPSDMRHVVTYDLITDAIARATIGHVALVETIAEDVAAMILAHPRVCGVDVTVEKLDLGPGSLGCRIARRRAG